MKFGAMNRRGFLGSTGRLAGGLLAVPWLAAGCVRVDSAAHPLAHAAEPEDAESKLTADQALEKLLAGNERFVREHAKHPRQSDERRRHVAKGQHPFAVVFGCADSRVTPELVFDQGVGDMFVIREIGHVMDDEPLASIEYAVEHLHVPLVVVLGHGGCGAVKAALDLMLKGAEPGGHITKVIERIKPAIAKARDRQGDVLDFAVRANTEYVASQMRAAKPVLAEFVEAKKVRIVGAHYDLQSGKVEVVA